MSDDKQLDNDPERTLITLDQLSQTIEVMTSVVNRLRQHLSDQLNAQLQAQQEQDDQQSKETANTDQSAEDHSADDKLQAIDVEQSKQQEPLQRESIVVEISQPETDPPPRKSDKTLH